MAQPINKWSEFKQVLKQLKDPKVKERFETIIIDTVDIAWDLAEKFICQREGVDKISDIPYGGGYALVEKEVDECLRSIPLMDYGLVMISHAEDKEFTDENGKSFNKIVPTLPKRARKIVLRMCDIIGYSRTVQDDDGNTTVNLYMRGTPRFEAGSRWRHTPPYIKFDYNNLVNAIAEAIEKQEQEEGFTATDEYINLYKETTSYSYDELKEQASEIINTLMEKDENNASKITKIVETHLGKGKKLSETTEDQVDIIALIVDDLKEILNKLS